MADVDNDGDTEMNQSKIGEYQIIEHMNTVGERIVASLEGSRNAVLTRLDDIVRLRDNTTRPPPDSEHDKNPNIFQLQSESEMQKGLLESEKNKELLDLAQAKVFSLEVEVQARDKRVEELELALSKSRADAKRLNSIIISSSAPQTGPSDDQVRAEFCGVRDSILKITRGYYQARSLSSSHRFRKESTTMAERQREYLGNWSQDTVELRNYRVQGAMFDIIYGAFFSRPIFGAACELDQYLGDFEKCISQYRQVSKADVAEWRRRTVVAAQSYPAKSNQERAERTADKIEDTLEPVRALPSRQISATKATEQLPRELDILCVNALQLALMLRSSKAHFTVVKAPYHAVVDEENMELVAMDGKIHPSRAKVAFTVFGGLEKTTVLPGDSEVTIRLEKPQVVGI